MSVILWRKRETALINSGSRHLNTTVRDQYHAIRLELTETIKNNIKRQDAEAQKRRSNSYVVKRQNFHLLLSVSAFRHRWVTVAEHQPISLHSEKATVITLKKYATNVTNSPISVGSSAQTAATGGSI